MLSHRLATPANVIESAGCSILGRNRVANEDAWGANETARVFVVADGCGGVSSGRSAADIAVATIRQCDAPDLPQSADVPLPPRGMDPLAVAVHVANERIGRAAVGDQRGMGSAVAAVRFELPLVVTAHVGDCRIYRYRRGYADSYHGVDAQGGMLTRLTLDHDLRAEMLKGGSSLAEIETVVPAHGMVMTRALGMADRIDIDVQYSWVVVGDLYLLCTDGVTRQLPDAEIRSIIANERHSIAGRCDELVQAADRRSGHDNVTAVLVRVGQSSAGAQPEAA